MTPPHIVARELAANGQALRTLARDLVGPGDAPDLVQETALRALRSPPPAPHGLGPWLATVLRNLAGNHRRDRLRRRLGEGALGEGREPAVAAADLAARREALRAVSDALWQLPEPYQGTLVSRYFENLTPTQIAERTRVPVATVKSRLQRGLQRLRDQFDARDRSWRAVLPIAAASAPVPGLLATTTAILMTPTTKVLSAAAIVAVAACLVFAWNRNEPAPARDEASNGGPAVAATSGAVIDGPTADERERVAIDPVADDVDLRHRFEFRLSCRVFDRDGLPVGGGTVAFGPRDSALNSWPVKTDGDGRVELSWRGREREMQMSIGLIERGHAQSLRRIDVRAGASRLVMLADRGGGGGGCAGARVATGHECRVCHGSAVLPDVFDKHMPLREGLHPESRLADLLLASPVTRELHGQAPPPPGPDDVELETEETEFSTSDVTGSDVTGSEVTGYGTIRGTVLGVDDEPVRGATVVWTNATGRPFGRTETDGEGAFLLQNVRPGTLRVRAGGGDPGLGYADVLVFAAQEARCEVRLLHGEVLRGRMHLPTGKSAAGWRVEYVAADETWIDGTMVQLDGTFTLPNQPPGSGTLLLWANNAPRLPAAIDNTARVGSTDLTFDLRALGVPAGQLRVTPLDPLSGEPADVAVWVWQVESGRGAMAHHIRGGVYALDRLAPGFYRVAIGGPGVGWRDLGEHWVHGEVDLGSVRLPDPVEVTLTGVPRGRPFELYLRRSDLDLRGEFGVGGRTRLLLPPGRWLALWGEPEALRRREFLIEADGTVLDFAR